MKRTHEEIQAQIKGLEKMKTGLPEFSIFGDPNHEAIDAQIDILDGGSLDDYDENEQEYVFSQAMEAEAWLNGESDENLFDRRMKRLKYYTGKTLSFFGIGVLYLLVCFPDVLK